MPGVNKTEQRAGTVDEADDPFWKQRALLEWRGGLEVTAAQLHAKLKRLGGKQYQGKLADAAAVMEEVAADEEHGWRLGVYCEQGLAMGKAFFEKHLPTVGVIEGDPRTDGVAAQARLLRRYGVAWPSFLPRTLLRAVADGPEASAAERAAALLDATKGRRF